ncbi:sigma 54-interacting transcriptional regulator [Thalassoglobus sp.]|uniref:sigma 54-interacting transcriptional regulator n=1 Tax=Thalassoglobus sp. TaxID=2795869 RepID=UPI003AA99C36
MSNRPTTLRELKESGYQTISVKTEMRRNLISKLRNRETLFPGILGYDETVIPQIVNGILAKHDLLFLGLRGQGKTRMLRMLTQFLDEAIPIVSGSEIHDDPLSPISRFARDVVQNQGDETPIEWISREERYLEKLATPDVTIADLIGEVDLIKHAEGRHLSNEDVMHFGLIPRSHRGIFCMNELPDLSPKIQVGLFNVLEERDVQIRGFTVRLPVDVCMVFSANPEDYTNRGRIVTPLKDRIGSVIRTHYPLERELGIQILDEQAWATRNEDGNDVIVPTFLKEIVEEMSRLARTSPHVNQASGVSVRMSIANLESLISNAERRSLVHGEDVPVARVSDLFWMAPSSRGKIELGLTEETGDEDVLIHRLIEEAIKNLFDQYLSPKRFSNVVEHFNSGHRLKLDPESGTSEFLSEMEKIRGFEDQLTQIAADLAPEQSEGSAAAGIRAAIAEFILEGLYAHNRLNRQMRFGQFVYGE